MKRGKGAVNLAAPFLWRPTGRDIPSDPAAWKERLEDDAICHWGGLVLRYEQLYERCWWWAVYIGADEISSNDAGVVGRTHDEARRLAEAHAYILAAHYKRHGVYRGHAVARAKRRGSR